MRLIMSASLGALFCSATLASASFRHVSHQTPTSPAQFLRQVQPVALRPPHSDAVWLVVASRSTEYEAIDLAQSYAPTLGPTIVAQGRNGVFAVIAGTLNADKAKPNLKTLKELLIIPQDSFLSRGDNFERVSWASFERGDSLDFMAQPAYRRVVQRIQAAMTRLSLYRGAIDGLIGPSTVDAFQSYVVDFGVPAGDLLTELTLSEMERGAGDGFRNDQERDVAQSLGFTEAASYREAVVGGFPSASVFSQAKELGFTTQREFDAAVTGGFRSRDEYQKALAAGFESAEDFRAAQSRGIQSKAELDAYRSSGFNDPVEFKTAKQKGFADKATYDKAEARRLATSKAAAVILLSDAQMYLKLNPNTANLVEIADQSAALNAQVQTKSADALNDLSIRLTNLLMGVPGFAEFSAARDKERFDDVEKQKAEILAELQVQQRVLKSWMAANLTSNKLPLVVSEVKALDLISGASDLDAMVEARISVRSLIATQRLTEELAALNSTDKGRDDGQVAGSGGVAITELNKVLLEGGLEDVVILYNAGPTAPSLLKTLSGEFSFTKNEASVCLLGVENTTSFVKVLREAVEPLGAKAIQLSKACDGGDITKNDLFLIQRKQFLESKPSITIAYVDALETRTLRLFGDIQYSDLKREIESDQFLAIQIASGVESGARVGYGGIQLDNNSNAICAVIEGTPAIHASTVDRFAAYVGIPVTHPDIATVDAAYEKVRRNICRVLYGSSGTLKAVAAALARDDVKFSYIPIWLDQKDVEAAQAKLDLNLKESVRKQEADRIAVQNEERIAAQLAAEQQKTRQAQEAALRQKNGPDATAALNTFTAAFETLTLGTSSKGAAQVDINNLFPVFATWNQQLSKEAWKSINVDLSIADFGTVNWKSRNLKAIRFKTVVKIASAERGEYRDECFLFGAVLDEEFNMVRDPYESSCGEDQSDTWAVGHEFQSLWQAR